MCKDKTHEEAVVIFRRPFHPNAELVRALLSASPTESTPPPTSSRESDGRRRHLEPKSTR